MYLNIINHPLWLDPALLFLSYCDTVGHGRANVPFELGLQGKSKVCVELSLQNVFYLVLGSGAPSSMYYRTSKVPWNPFLLALAGRNGAPLYSGGFFEELYPAPSSRTPSEVNGRLPWLVATNRVVPGRNLLLCRILSKRSTSSWRSYGSGIYSIYPNKFLFVVLPNPFLAGLVRKFLACVLTSPVGVRVLKTLSLYSFMCSNSECLLDD